MQQPTDKRKKTMLIGLVAVMLVLLAAVVWTWRKTPAEPDFEAGRAVADNFLALVRAGQTKQAWESTTAEFKSAQGQESFAEQVKGHPALAKPASFVSVQSVTVQDSPRAEYLYRLADGKVVRLLAGQEGGAWRVDRLRID
jgi:hypothetical protein